MSIKAAEQVADNENATVTGKQKVHPDPSDRRPGTIDAKWGDKPMSSRGPFPDHYSTGVLEEGNKDRADMLRDMFDDFEPAASADKAVVNQNFATPENQRHAPHSPLLQTGKAKLGEAYLRSSPTLREQIRGIIGE